MSNNLPKQSGEPASQNKDVGMKHGPQRDEQEIKRGVDVRGGDNGDLSDEDLDENEIQQAGGNNNGGVVPGAFGRDSDADGHKSLNEGM